MAKNPRRSTPLSTFLSVFSLILAVVALSLTTNVSAAPTPSPRPARWEIDFKVKHELRLVSLSGEYYWFMTYLVTNNTGEDQTFVPSATLYTDAGEIVDDGDVDLDVIDEMLELLSMPLLEAKNDILGTILQGKENAREGLLIWKAGSLDIDHVTVFVSGLSSETQVALNSFTGEETVVRKAKAREYEVPGDPLANVRRPGLFTGEHWIMR